MTILHSDTWLWLWLRSGWSPDRFGWRGWGACRMRYCMWGLKAWQCIGVMPQDDGYDVDIFNDRGLQRPDWPWSWSSTSVCYMNLHLASVFLWCEALLQKWRKSWEVNLQIYPLKNLGTRGSSLCGTGRAGWQGSSTDIDVWNRVKWGPWWTLVNLNSTSPSMIFHVVACDFIFWMISASYFLIIFNVMRANSIDDSVWHSVSFSAARVPPIHCNSKIYRPCLRCWQRAFWGHVWVSRGSWPGKGWTKTT